MVHDEDFGSDLSESESGGKTWLLYTGHTFYMYILQK